MPKLAKIVGARAVNNGHGGSRVAQRNGKYNLPANATERVAGDWIPECQIPNGIDVEQLLSDDLFSFSNHNQMFNDGYSLEEIISPEDMYPSMYRRVVNS